MDQNKETNDNDITNKDNTFPPSDHCDNIIPEKKASDNEKEINSSEAEGKKDDIPNENSSTSDEIISVDTSNKTEADKTEADKTCEIIKDAKTGSDINVAITDINTSKEDSNTKKDSSDQSISNNPIHPTIDTLDEPSRENLLADETKKEYTYKKTLLPRFKCLNFLYSDDPEFVALQKKLKGKQRLTPSEWRYLRQRRKKRRIFRTTVRTVVFATLFAIAFVLFMRFLGDTELKIANDDGDYKETTSTGVPVPTPNLDVSGDADEIKNKIELLETPYPTASTDASTIVTDPYSDSPIIGVQP